MSLHNKRIQDIVFEDVLSFCCENHKESQDLEYKQDWTDNLIDAITAFANTSGGLILLGVAEDAKTGCPQTPVTGIDIKGGEDELERMLDNKAYDGIWPPVFPERKAIRLPDNPQRAVLVIRVQQSHQSPHAADGRRKVYIRVKSQNRFVNSLATMEQLGWLWERRKKSEQLREAMLSDAQQIVTKTKARTGDNGAPCTTTEFYALPLFPHLPILSLSSLMQHTNIEGKGGVDRFDNRYPIVENTRPVADGILMNGSRSSAEWHGALINIWGAIYWQQRLTAEAEPNGRITPPFMFANWLLGYFDAFLSYLKLFFEKTGAPEATLYQIVVRLTVPDDMAILVEGDVRFLPVRRPVFLGVSPVQLLQEIAAPRNLCDLRSDWIISMITSLLWATGHSWASDNMQVRQWAQKFVALDT